jgi:hypothetical protein
MAEHEPNVQTQKNFGYSRCPKCAGLWWRDRAGYAIDDLPRQEGHLPYRVGARGRRQS